MNTKTNWWLWLGSSALCLLAALPSASRGDAAGAVGNMIAFAFPPFLVAFIARGRKGDWDGLGKWFFYGLLFCVPFAVQQGKDWRYGSKDQQVKHLAELLRNIQAGRPEAAVADPTPLDDTYRGFIADLASAKKIYETATAHIDLSDIYTTQSFATKDSMQRALTRVQALAAADNSIYNSWLSAPRDLEKRLRQSSLSESDQEHFVVGVRESLDKSPLIPYYKTECDWSASLVSLYSFALLHSSEIHVGRKGLVIDPKSFNEFKQKQDTSLALRKTVMTLELRVNKRQQEIVKEFGLQKQ